MNKKGFDDYLDNKTPPGTDEERQLALLLEEVADLPEADPGQEYWNNFNSRLQQKLDITPARQGFFAWLARPINAVGAFAVIAAMVLVFLPRNGLVTDQVPVLADLDRSELNLLVSAFEDPYATYAFDESDAATQVELADVELDLLLNVYEDNALATENFNAKEFLALWETEG